MLQAFAGQGSQELWAKCRTEPDQVGKASLKAEQATKLSKMEAGKAGAPLRSEAQQAGKASRLESEDLQAT